MVVQNARTPRRGGAIITMSSVNAVLAIPTAAGYNAAKGGVSSLTRCCNPLPFAHFISACLNKMDLSSAGQTSDQPGVAGGDGT